MLTAVAGYKPDAGEYAFIDQVIARHSARPGALLGILEEIQENNPRKFLCTDVIRYTADKRELHQSQIFSAVTFHALFNREPKGEHIITICRGAARHTRGSRDLLDTLRIELGLHRAEESTDGDAGAGARVGPQDLRSHELVFAGTRGGGARGERE